jgi:hypothetical protein
MQLRNCWNLLRRCRRWFCIFAFIAFVVCAVQLVLLFLATAILIIATVIASGSVCFALLIICWIYCVLDVILGATAGNRVNWDECVTRCTEGEEPADTTQPAAVVPPVDVGPSVGGVGVASGANVIVLKSAKELREVARSKWDIFLPSRSTVRLEIRGLDPRARSSLESRINAYLFRCGCREGALGFLLAASAVALYLSPLNITAPEVTPSVLAAGFGIAVFTGLIGKTVGILYGRAVIRRLAGELERRDA